MEPCPRGPASLPAPGGHVAVSVWRQEGACLLGTVLALPPCPPPSSPLSGSIGVGGELTVPRRTLPLSSLPTGSASSAPGGSGARWGSAEQSSLPPQKGPQFPETLSFGHRSRKPPRAGHGVRAGTVQPLGGAFPVELRCWGRGRGRGSARELGPGTLRAGGSAPSSEGPGVPPGGTGFSRPVSSSEGNAVPTPSRLDADGVPLLPPIAPVSAQRLAEPQSP